MKATRSRIVPTAICSDGLTVRFAVLAKLDP